MEPAKDKFNRIIKQGETESVNISLVDVDTVIANYMQKNIIPELEQNGKKITVPLLYGNAERWKTAQRDGYLRDKEGRIQLPLIMFSRNSIEKNDNIRFLKDEKVTYPTIKKYSQKNAYDRFSLLNPKISRRYETFDVRMPDYVNLTYQVMVWASYTEHINKIQEAFSYAGEQYWGEAGGYRFRTVISNFENTQELGAGTERIVRSTFSIVVYAYILPKRVADGSSTTVKGFTPRTVVVTSEVVTNISTQSDLEAYTETAQYSQNNPTK